MAASFRETFATAVQTAQAETDRLVELAKKNVKGPEVIADLRTVLHLALSCREMGQKQPPEDLGASQTMDLFRLRSAATSLADRNPFTKRIEHGTKAIGAN